MSWCLTALCGQLQAAFKLLRLIAVVKANESVGGNQLMINQWAEAAADALSAKAQARMLLGGSVSPPGTLDSWRGGLGLTLRLFQQPAIKAKVGAHLAGLELLLHVTEGLQASPERRLQRLCNNLHRGPCGRTGKNWKLGCRSG